MKRALYRHGIEIIALNDEPTEMNPEEIKGFISVCLLADLFDVGVERVAADVLKFRKKEANDLDTRFNEQMKAYENDFEKSKKENDNE